MSFSRGLAMRYIRIYDSFTQRIKHPKSLCTSLPFLLLLLDTYDSPYNEKNMLELVEMGS